jgi:1-acyl-sn-glycerol-3-phosphate acyltransferase
MIPSRRTEFASYLFYRYVRWWMGRKFNVIKPMPFTPKPGHSIFLLINHFSWWDGFFGNYMADTNLGRKFHIMMQHDHFMKHFYFKYIGAFSMKKSSRDMVESLAFTAKLLSDPENMVVVFPQGELCSNHVTHVNVEKGIERIIKQIKGPCQIVYACTLIEYFESLKPSAYIHLYDCGVAGEVPFDTLVANINTFHTQALKDQVNMAH